MTVAYSPSHGLGEEQSIWFKLTPLLNQENPMQVLMALSDKYGGVIPINLKNQRVVLLSVKKAPAGDRTKKERPAWTSFPDCALRRVCAFRWRRRSLSAPWG